MTEQPKRRVLPRVLPFRLFESVMDPVAPPGATASRLAGVEVPESPPPHSLIGFYWHFARQARLLFAALFGAGLVVALLDLLIPLFIGRVIGLLETYGPEPVSYTHLTLPTICSV